MFGSFLPSSPTPSLTPLSLTPSIPGRNYFALISNFVVERVSAIIGRTKDQGFLLVEIRIAIQGVDSH
jgi:hypothetical protein